MSFYFPLGLLGLIGIPILIIIYIIKSKYTEQTIASTYLWELSERFLKKRKPISKLTGILTLILQILAVLTASLLIAHPVFSVPASANDYYFILDGSASMNMSADGVTRFERAQKEINGLINDSLGGSKYSLVFVRDSATVVFEGVTDKEQAKASINALQAGWGSTECSSAAISAQEYYDYNRSALVYLVTDKEYDVENVRLIDVSGGESNYAFLEAGKSDGADGVSGVGKVVSYSRDASVTVEMYAGDRVGAAPKKIGQTRVQLKKGEPCDFEVTSEVSSYNFLQLKIATGDALSQDNIVILYDEAKAQVRKVAIISDLRDTPYLRTAILTAGSAEKVEVVSTKEYEENGAPEDCGLYVFNGYAPAQLPKNKAIWLVDAVDGVGKGSGVNFRDYQTPEDSTGYGSYYTPQYIRPGSALEKELVTDDLVKREFAVRTYAKYGIPRSFTSVLKVGNDSLVSVGLNENNDRQVVIAFQIGNSSLGLQDDFLILTRNLMNYSFPRLLSGTTFVCGEDMKVNVVPGCESIVVRSPSGNSSTLDTIDNDYCLVPLSETGTYLVTAKIAGSDEVVLPVYACVPEIESRSEKGGEFRLSGEPEHEYSDGFYDKLLAFFIVVAVLLLADWGVYCYEQYQLR